MMTNQKDSHQVNNYAQVNQGKLKDDM